MPLQIKNNPVLCSFSVEVTPSECTPSATTLSTSAPPVGFTRLIPFESGAIFSDAVEHIYDVPRLPRPASNPEMGHTRVYDTPCGSGGGRHVSDPLPQIDKSQTADEIPDENIYDVPRNCDDDDDDDDGDGDDADGASASIQFVVDDIYDTPTETDDIYVVPSTALPIPTCDTTVDLKLSSADIGSTLTVQLNETTRDSDLCITTPKSSKPVVPPKPPRRRAKPVSPENVYAIPRKVSTVLSTSKDFVA